MAEWIGEPIDRIDGRLKVSGRAPYAYEHEVPGAVYASLVVSTIAKGQIVSIDTHAAKRTHGVLLVMTHLNAPKLPKLQTRPKKPPRDESFKCCRTI
jgi:xanthine dehydrogenase YagR molybdenum-binding subunit